MSNHVCREVLCLIQKPGNVASFLPLAYEALFDMRGRLQCTRSLHSFLCSSFISFQSLPLFSSATFSSHRTRAAFGVDLLFSFSLLIPEKTRCNAQMGSIGEIASTFSRKELEYSEYLFPLHQYKYTSHFISYN